jgi:hypothetical protein
MENAGNMQLLLQGETSFRYGIMVHEGGRGNVRFAINDKVRQIPLVDMTSLTSRNYADGEWHYLLAEYTPDSGSNGMLSLTIANEDGTSDTATLFGWHRGLGREGPSFKDGLPSYVRLQRPELPRTTLQPWGGRGASGRLPNASL